MTYSEIYDDLVERLLDLDTPTWILFHTLSPGERDEIIKIILEKEAIEPDENGDYTQHALDLAIVGIDVAVESVIIKRHPHYRYVYPYFEQEEFERSDLLDLHHLLTEIKRREIFPSPISYWNRLLRTSINLLEDALF